MQVSFVTYAPTFIVVFRSFGCLVDRILTFVVVERLTREVTFFQQPSGVSSGAFVSPDHSLGLGEKLLNDRRLSSTSSRLIVDSYRLSLSITRLTVTRLVIYW